MKRHRWPMGALVLLAILLASPLWRDGIAGSDDILDSIYRVFALSGSWAAGIGYPRLGPDLAYGYSAPLFQYYPPLASYMAQIFHLMGAGFIGSVKLTAAAGLLLSGIGMYVYGLRLFGNGAGALLAAIAYMSAPYQLADIYIRGATAEGIALAFLPWILWSVHELHERGGRGWFVLTALLMGGLIVTHNSVSLFFLVIVAGYAVFLGAGRALLRSLAALGLGLGLSCFFWLPAVIERGSVDILSLAEGFYDPVNNLVPWAQLIQRSLLFDYTRPTVFVLPLALSVIAVAGALVALLHRDSAPSRRIVWFLVLLVAVCIVLQLPAAAWFWEHVPLVGFIQFPWRLFAFVTLGSAVFAGAIPTALKHAHLPVLAGLFGALAVTLLVAAGGRLWSDYGAAYEAGRFTEGQIGREDMYARGRVGFELFSDYSPVWVKESMTDLATGDPTVGPALALTEPAPDVAILRIEGFTTELWVDAENAFPLTIHRFYFPGWRARIDGVAAPVYASGSLGLVTVDVPAGGHTILLEFTSAAVRGVAASISFASVLVCLVGLAPLFRRRPWVAAVVLVAIFGAYGGWRYFHRPIRPAIHEPVTANLGGVAELVGFALDRPEYFAGDTVHVTLGWFALDSIDKDYKVFIHLRDADDRTTYAQHDGTPVFGYTPTTRWLPGELLTDAHELRLPEDLPPGKYLLVAGLYDPVSLRNLPVEEAREVMTGERLLVEEIVIRPR